MSASRAVGVLVIVLLAASSFARATQARADSGSLAGRVVDGMTQAPLSGATVKLVYDGDDHCDACSSSSSSPEIPNILTGADGRFEFSHLPAGVYAVRAAKPGYPVGAFGVRRASGEPAPVRLLDGARVDGLTVPLFRRAVVSGTITDRDGEPMAGRAISFIPKIPGTSIFPDNRNQYFERGVWSPVSTVRTDDRGHYVAQVQAGEFLVLLRIEWDRFPAGRSSGDGAAAFVSTFYPGAASYEGAVPITLEPGQERMGVSFCVQTAPVGSVTGRVQDFVASRDSANLELHSVTIPDRARPDSYRQQARPDGGFTFSDLPAGAYLLEVAHTSPSGGREPLQLRRATMPVVVRGGEATDVTVQTRPHTFVSGSIATDGVPAADRHGLRVWLASAEGSVGCGPAPWDGTKIDGGSFSIPVPRPGRYRVCATSPSLHVLGLATIGAQDVVDAPLTVGESDVSGVVITFGLCVSGLAGSVRDERGSPVREGWVIAFPVDRRLWAQAPVAGPRFAAARVSTDGTYRIAGLVEGEYFVGSITDQNMAAWPSLPMLEAMAVHAGRVAVPRDRALALDLAIGR